MIISATLLISFLAVSGLAFGYSSGRASGDRMRNLVDGLRCGRPEAFAVLAVVGAVIVYVFWSYEPPRP